MGRLKTGQEKKRKKYNNDYSIKKPFNRRKQMKPIAPGILPGVKPEDLKTVGCKDCGPTQFIPISDIKLASQFQTSIGQPMIVNFQGGFACSKCGKVNHFDRTPEGKEKKEDTPNAEPSRIIH